MRRRPIPDRDPVTDTITGSLVTLNGETLLIITPTADLTAGSTRMTGALTVRYGFRYFGKPHLSVVLGLLALDYGEMQTGERAFETLRKQYGRYPRADVIGYRNDGVDEMTVAKNLDMDLPLHVHIYAQPADTQPIATISALIATDEEAATLPTRLTEALPRFQTMTAWQATQDGDA